MDDIAELERRIASALDRIGAGIERRQQAPRAPAIAAMAELDRLREELDEERMANAQLGERLKVQRERADRATADLRGEVERLSRQVDDQALAMQRLVTSTIQMREEMRRLREAAAEGAVPGPALFDKALSAEVEAQRAARAAEATELAALVAVLRPIVDAEEARAHA